MTTNQPASFLRRSSENVDAMFIAAVEIMANRREVSIAAMHVCWVESLPSLYGV